MAQNITILGASYSNVPAVTLPKTGGGTARFTDVSDSTVTASTVLAGYKAYNASGASVTGTYIPTLQSKNATPTKLQQTVTPDSGYDGLSNVTVNPIPSEYIVPSGTQTITENGTVDVTSLASVTVNVATSDGIMQDADGYLVLSDQGGGSGGGGGSSGGGGASNVVYGSFTTNASEGVQTVNVPYSGSGYPIEISVFPPNGSTSIGGSSVDDKVITGVYLLKCDSTTAPTYNGNVYENRYSYWVRYTSGGTSTAAQGPSGSFISSGAVASANTASSLRPTSNTTLSIYVRGTSYGFLPETEYKYVVVYSEEVMI